jgi:PhoPQ-activated pathogenicity-related protein
MLKRTRKRLNIPSIRRNPHTLEQQLQKIVEVTDKGPSTGWGVGYIREALADEGVLVKRYLISQYLS